MKSSGFTLIELMVVITIMLLLVGGAMAGFIAFSDRRDVQESARQVQQMFVLAQQKASVREVPTACLTAARPLRAYRVTISDGAPHTVSVVAICAAETIANFDTDPLPAGVTTSTVESVVLPDSVSITQDDSFLDFYTLEGGISTTRTYQFTGATNYSFTVSDGGRVSNVQ